MLKLEKGKWIVLCLAAMLAALPAVQAAGSAPVSQAGVLGIQAVDVPTYQRLIIRLRDSAVPAGSTYQARTAQLEISGLDNRVQPHVARLGAVPLSLLKSITPQLHVASIGQPLSRAEMQELVQQLQQDTRVQYAEIDERIFPQLVPNDPYYGSDQWNLKPAALGQEGGANLPGAWDKARGQGAVVAVLDTGIRPHAELAANILTGYDFVSDVAMANDGNGRDPDPSDPGDWVDGTESPPLSCAQSASSWHGTMMAGAIAAITDNGTGVAGIAPQAHILPVRVFGKCGGYVSDVVDGVYWAAGLPVADAPLNTNPARVLNLSMSALGSCGQSFQDAIWAARGRGAVVIAATGNSNSDGLSQPANCSGVIAVTAHTRRGDLADYASIGPGVALSAPGGGNGHNHLNGDGDWIVSTANSGTTVPASDSYSLVAGTSMATAHASGVAALLLGLEPGLTPDQIKWLLSATARAFQPGTYCYGISDCGSGMLDAQAAVQRLQSGPLPTVPTETPPASGGGGGGAPGWLDALGLLSIGLVLRRASRRQATRRE